MPRVYLTDAQRLAGYEKQQRDRRRRIICAVMASRDYNRKKLAAETKIEYAGLCRRIRGTGDFMEYELTRVANALKMDTVTRAALMGGEEKCQWEN